MCVLYCIVLYCIVLYCIVLYCIVYIVPVSVITQAAVYMPRRGILSAVAENVLETNFSHALKCGLLVYSFGE